MVTKGDGRKINEEFGINIHTPVIYLFTYKTCLYIKQVNSKDLLYSTGNYLVINYNGRVWKRMYICVYIYRNIHIWEYIYIYGIPSGSAVKNLPAMQEMHIWSPGWEDPLEKEMATHSSILAWEIPWTEEPGRLQSMGSQSQTQLSD